MDKPNQITEEIRLQRQQQLPAIIVLLLNTGVMWFGFFMLIPLVALHATRDLGVSAAMAGLVLAVRQFVQQGLGVFIAAAADWLGYRRMMLAGALIRAAGFVYLAFAPDALHLMLSGVLAAVGGACFDSSGKAAMAAISRGYNRESIFSLTSTVGNIGMTLGPLVGVLLLTFDFKIVGLVSASTYLVSFALLFIFVPTIPPASHAGQRLGVAQIFGQLATVRKNKPFMLVSIMLAGYYILSAQINITLPLFTAHLTGNNSSVALIYGINSGLAILFQYFTVQFLRKFLKPISIIGLGTALAGLGLFLVAFAHDLLFLVFCVVIYSFGRMVVEPVFYSITAQFATEDTMASYFGFSSLALAIGGVIGNLLGGWLFDLGSQIGFPALSWFAFGIVSLIVVAGIFGSQFHRTQVSPRQGLPEAVPSPSDQI